MFGNASDDDVNKALQMTGSSYQVGQPYQGNPTQFELNNDDRRRIAQENGNLDVANAADKAQSSGGKQGGGMMGMMGGMGGGGGGGMGGGGGKYANPGGKPYQSPPPSETQSQMIERQYALRNSAEQQKVQNIAAIVGKIFGF